jgi:hypothetical protein
MKRRWTRKGEVRFNLADRQIRQPGYLIALRPVAFRPRLTTVGFIGYGPNSI